MVGASLAWALRVSRALQISAVTRSRPRPRCTSSTRPERTSSAHHHARKDMMARNSATTGSTGSATMPMTMSAKMAIGRSKIDCASPPVTVPRTEATSRKYRCHTEAGRASSARSGRPSIEFSSARHTVVDDGARVAQQPRAGACAARTRCCRKKQNAADQRGKRRGTAARDTRSYTCSRKIEAAARTG